MNREVNDARRSSNRFDPSGDLLLLLRETLRRKELVNLGVGVYTDDNGKVPVLQCVRKAEQKLAESPLPRNYVPIDGLSVEMEADIDFRGLLGHDKSVRNGFTDIRYTVTIESPAPEEKVRRCKETIDRKSPVGDTLANPVKITSTFVHKRS